MTKTYQMVPQVLLLDMKHCKEWLSFNWNSERKHYTYSSKENQTDQVFITADNFVL